MKDKSLLALNWPNKTSYLLIKSRVKLPIELRVFLTTINTERVKLTVIMYVSLLVK